MKRKVQAQRKFAQGAPIPPSNISNSERRIDATPSREDQRNVVRNNTAVKAFLDIISFKQIHIHKRPVVVLERLRTTPINPFPINQRNEEAEVSRYEGGEPHDGRTDNYHLNGNTNDSTTNDNASCGSSVSNNSSRTIMRLRSRNRSNKKSDENNTTEFIEPQDPTHHNENDINTNRNQRAQIIPLPRILRSSSCTASDFSIDEDKPLAQYVARKKTLSAVKTARQQTNVSKKKQNKVLKKSNQMNKSYKRGLLRVRKSIPFDHRDVKVAVPSNISATPVTSIRDKKSQRNKRAFSEVRQCSSPKELPDSALISISDTEILSENEDDSSLHSHLYKSDLQVLDNAAALKKRRLTLNTVECDTFTSNSYPLVDSPEPVPLNDQATLTKLPHAEDKPIEIDDEDNKPTTALNFESFNSASITSLCPIKNYSDFSGIIKAPWRQIKRRCNICQYCKNNDKFIQLRAIIEMYNNEELAVFENTDANLGSLNKEYFLETNNTWNDSITLDFDILEESSTNILRISHFRHKIELSKPVLLCSLVPKSPSGMPSVETQSATTILQYLDEHFSIFPATGELINFETENEIVNISKNKIKIVNKKLANQQNESCVPSLCLDFHHDFDSENIRLVSIEELIEPFETEAMDYYAMEVTPDNNEDIHLVTLQSEAATVLDLNDSDVNCPFKHIQIERIHSLNKDYLSKVDREASKELLENTPQIGPDNPNFLIIYGPPETDEKPLTLNSQNYAEENDDTPLSLICPQTPNQNNTHSLNNAFLPASNNYKDELKNVDGSSKSTDLSNNSNTSSARVQTSHSPVSNRHSVDCSNSGEPENPPQSDHMPPASVNHEIENEEIKHEKHNEEIRRENDKEEITYNTEEIIHDNDRDEITHQDEKEEIVLENVSNEITHENDHEEITHDNEETTHEDNNEETMQENDNEEIMHEGFDDSSDLEPLIYEDDDEPPQPPKLPIYKEIRKIIEEKIKINNVPRNINFNFYNSAAVNINRIDNGDTLQSVLQSINSTIPNVPSTSKSNTTTDVGNAESVKVRSNVRTSQDSSISSDNGLASTTIEYSNSTRSTCVPTISSQVNSRPCSLDMTRRRTPSHLQPLPGQPFLNAPVFSPTDEEFLDPISYFESITPKASKYGICKVIPPKGFVPSCALNDEMMFNVTNQYVTRLFSRWGPGSREMSTIKAYLASQSVYFKRPPLYEGMEVNLPKLYQIVQRHGGLKKVIERKRWSRVAEEIRFTKGPNPEKKLDQFYVKYLLPYDTLSCWERGEIMSRVERAWCDKFRKMSNRAFEPLHRQSKLLSGSESSSEEGGCSDDDPYITGALTEAEECVMQGRKMNLTTFKKIASSALETFFPSPTRPDIFDVEEEYWRLVLLGSEHMCVISASIDTGTAGYGFTSNPNEEYGAHPWNLKNLTDTPGNILRYLGPVLGVTVPTLHLGMIFSTSCWHRDPHGLPWMEYMHSGPPKIWYGIPDEQSNRFRKAVESLCPSSCQNKTIWLPSDIAMIPPHLLHEQNVALSRVEQNPGEYIIVFPKAYSCSISTGFTVSESVYFASKSWLHNGLEFFLEAQVSCEPTMISIESLLISILKDLNTPLAVLQPTLTVIHSLLKSEVCYRSILENELPPHLKNTAIKHLTHPPGAWNVRDQDECEVCRKSLYLSRIRGLTRNSSSLCLEHGLDVVKSKITNDEPVPSYELDYYLPTKELESVLEIAETRMFRISGTRHTITFD